jgi:NAD(P)-dependent dehydrogenase (short-subunit alcohol dehydrogenase family)
MTQVAVVTGAAGAMGSACASALSPTVDQLLLADCDARGIDAVAARLSDAGPAEVAVLVGDIGDAGYTSELAATAVALGTLRALIHTAGVSPSMASWRDILRIDLTGSDRLLSVLAEHVAPGTTAVCLASVSGLMGNFDPAMDAILDDPLDPGFPERFRSQFSDEPDSGSTYRLAKRGVIRSCERAAVAWGTKGGRVVSLSPGLIDTSMGQLELAEHPIKEEMARLTPIRSPRQDKNATLPGYVADIAAAAVFLCSDQAAFISGCDLRVDGGLVAAISHSRPHP